MRRGSTNRHHPSCTEDAMPRLILLSLALCLAACATRPETAPPGSGGGEPTLCDDGAHYDAVNAIPIEFGRAYELTSGRVFYRAVTDRPAEFTLRLDNLPDFGQVGFLVLDRVQQPAFGDSYSELEGPIPPSVTVTGKIEEAGAVFVRVEHTSFNPRETRCPRFQFSLFRD